MTTKLKNLYPEIAPYTSGRLRVSDLHDLHFEECGNPNGDPVLFLHGGPGGGCSPVNRRYFDPQHYRIILLDQRGAGKSTPHADLRNNTTWDLVSDIEVLRNKLGIQNWHVFGGSWGSTLALAYAETHPKAVKSLCLRGIFLCRKKDIAWFYQYGASEIFSDLWEPYKNFIPENERHDFVTAYYKRLTSDDQNVRLTAAKIWSIWEASTSKLVPDQNMMHDFGDPMFALAFARIECHYFTNGAFFETDNHLIENVGRIRHIPTEIVHGRYDVVCPFDQAWELHQAFPESKLHIVANAGHSAMEAGIIDKLVDVMDRFKEIK
jgi:proline iminopeptidase